VDIFPRFKPRKLDLVAKTICIMFGSAIGFVNGGGYTGWLDFRSKTIRSIPFGVYGR
jgi:hypothetical protein